MECRTKWPEKKAPNIATFYEMRTRGCNWYFCPGEFITGEWWP